MPIVGSLVQRAGKDDSRFYDRKKKKKMLHMFPLKFWGEKTYRTCILYVEVHES